MIDEVDGDGNDKEKGWISFFQVMGIWLLNATRGGGSKSNPSICKADVWCFRPHHDLSEKLNYYCREWNQPRSFVMDYFLRKRLKNDLPYYLQVVEKPVGGAG